MTFGYSIVVLKMEDIKMNSDVFKKDVFDRLETIFSDYENSYNKMILEQRGRSARKEISKGNLYNVIPYEVEMQGQKLNGKKIDQIIMDDECHVYYFDNEGKIILVESDPWETENEFYDFCAYFYEENKVYSVRGNRNYLMNVSVAVFNGELLLERYIGGKKGRRFQKYIYNENNVLNCVELFVINEESNVSKKEKYQFYYQNDDKVILIQRQCENGYKEFKYASVKPNYKMIKEKMKKEIVEAIHDMNKVHAVGFRLYLEESKPCIDISFETSNEINELIAEWSHVSAKNVEIVSFPIEIKQGKKLKKQFIEVLKEIVEEEIIDENVLFVVLEGDEEYIFQDYVKYM